MFERLLVQHERAVDLVELYIPVMQLSDVLLKLYVDVVCDGVRAQHELVNHLVLHQDAAQEIVDVFLVDVVLLSLDRKVVLQYIQFVVPAQHLHVQLEEIPYVLHHFLQVFTTRNLV